jgi:ZIP family zinc transporter
MSTLIQMLVLTTAAAGGILYLLFQDIAPQARLARRWAPTLGAVVGFGLGLLGDLLIGH